MGMVVPGLSHDGDEAPVFRIPVSDAVAAE
jgi:hypothetical protein